MAENIPLQAELALLEPTQFPEDEFPEPVQSPFDIGFEVVR